MGHRHVELDAITAFAGEARKIRVDGRSMKPVAMPARPLISYQFLSTQTSTFT
jgi:hypothetical protein